MIQLAALDRLGGASVLSGMEGLCGEEAGLTGEKWAAENEAA